MMVQVMKSCEEGWEGKQQQHCGIRRVPDQPSQTSFSSCKFRGQHLLERLARHVLLPLVQRSASDAANRQQHRRQRTLQGVKWLSHLQSAAELAFRIARPMLPSTPIRQYFQPVFVRTHVM
jgi:hypothetical protein